MIARNLFSQVTRGRAPEHLQVVFRGRLSSMASRRHGVHAEWLGEGRGVASMALKLNKHISTGYAHGRTFASHARSETRAIEEQIAEVANSVKLVQGQVVAVQDLVVDVGEKIERSKVSLKQNNLPPDDKAFLLLELESLMDEKKSLMDKEKSLMDKEKILMDKEKILKDKEESLLGKEQAEEAVQRQAEKAAYILAHKKWSGRDGLRASQVISATSMHRFAICQDFADVRKAKPQYLIDKTAFIKPFLQTKSVIFRRPRRFGKSLFLSTLKYFFYGATNLFEGLAVYNEMILREGQFVWCPSDPSKHNWPPCPVIFLDFSNLRGASSASDFSAKLIEMLAKVGKDNNVDVGAQESCPRKVLSDLVDGLSQQPLNKWGKVVILIDEYDAPLNERANDEISKEITKVYSLFFTKIKSLESSITFAYVTGITSHPLADIHSGANNFLDKSYSAEFESMCAITTDELCKAFKATRPLDPPLSDEKVKAIKEQYNGYSWNLQERGEEESHPSLFNPYFVALFCNEGRADDYWGATTSASLTARFPALIDIDLGEGWSIKRSKLEAPWFPSAVHSHVDCVRNLFEAGYLTVVDVRNDALDSPTMLPSSTDATVKLGIPNEQVRKLLMSDYISSLFPHGGIENTPAWQKAKMALLGDDLVQFFKSLDDIFATIPHQIASGFRFESAWHILAHTALSSMGVEFVAEESSAGGRSDLIIFVKDILYVMDFKVLEAKGSAAGLEREARAAISQIVSKGYFRGRFVTTKQSQVSKVVLVGVVADVTKGSRRFAMLAKCDFKPSNSSMHGPVSILPLLD